MMRARAMFAAVALALAAAPLATTADAQVREGTFRALGRADRAIEEERFADALAILDEMVPRVARVPLERALVQQARAVVLLAQERYAEAVPPLEASLEAGVLPDETTARLRFNLVQVDLVLDEPRRALGRIDGWFEGSDDTPPPELVALAGRAHYELGAYEAAATRLRAAVAAAPKPELWWYQLLLGCAYETKNYDEAFQILRILLAREPAETRYWIELARIALEIDREGAALSALELAEDVGPLDGKSVVLLARLHLQAGSPARAARLLRDAIEAERIPADGENLALLASAWTLAREYAPACDALQRAAALDPAERDRLLLRRAELLIQLDRSDEAQTDLTAAAASDDPELAARASMMLGVVLYRKSEYERSLAAFSVASRDAKVGERAREWERFVRARAESELEP